MTSPIPVLHVSKNRALLLGVAVFKINYEGNCEMNWKWNGMPSKWSDIWLVILSPNKIWSHWDGDRDKEKAIIKRIWV